MARKPARLERAGALLPRDRMWAAIRQLSSGCFSAAEIHWRANHGVPAPAQVHITTVLSYFDALRKAVPPYLSAQGASAERNRGELVLHRLVRDTGVDAPNLTSDGKPSRQAIGTVRMWRAMRVLREFTSLELACAASAPEHAVPLEAAQNYLRHLARAGYVTPIEKKKSGVRWRFVRSMNTGPRAPVVERAGSVVDGNTGKVAFDVAATGASS